MGKRNGHLFVPLDVDYPDNPKIIEAGEEAELLYVRALCLAKRTLSDGMVDRRQLPRTHLANVNRRAATLVRVGLWEYVKENGKVIGYRIIGFLDRNDSAEEVAELSKKRAVAGAKGGSARPSAQANGDQP